jgi:hypothetical protein
LHFRRDFDHDEVVALVDGQARFATQDLTTRRLLDLAQVVEFEVEPGPVRVEVVIQRPERRAQADLVVGRELDIEVWCLEGVLKLRAASSPPAYL